MTTLTHPHLRDVTKDVPDEDVPRWVASGWLAPEPAPDHSPAEPGEYDHEEETS